MKCTPWSFKDEFFVLRKWEICPSPHWVRQHPVKPFVNFAFILFFEVARTIYCIGVALLGHLSLFFLTSA
jgi:hypothetical protein